MCRCCKFGGRCGDQFGLFLQHMGYNNDTGVGLFPLFLVDSLAYRGHGFGGIAGVEARSINLVFKPWAVGQAFGVGKFALALDQKFVYVRERGRSHRAAPIGIYLLEGFAILGGATAERYSGVIQWSK